MICPVCLEHDAQEDAIYGFLPCVHCQNRRRRLRGPDHPVEFTSDEVRDGRRSHLKSIIQPWRSGQLSKEYIDMYGTNGISATDDEIASAKEVWKDLPNVDNLEKTK